MTEAATDRVGAMRPRPSCATLVTVATPPSEEGSHAPCVACLLAVRRRHTRLRGWKHGRRSPALRCGDAQQRHFGHHGHRLGRRSCVPRFGDHLLRQVRRHDDRPRELRRVRRGVQGQGVLRRREVSRQLPLAVDRLRRQVHQHRQRQPELRHLRRGVQGGRGVQRRKMRSHLCGAAHAVHSPSRSRRGSRRLRRALLREPGDRSPELRFLRHGVQGWRDLRGREVRRLLRRRNHRVLRRLP